MWRANSLEKALILKKTEGRSKREWQDEMVGWHHWLSGHKFDQTPGGGEGQGNLACCSLRSHKESDTTEQLTNNSNNKPAGSEWLQAVSDRSELDYWKHSWCQRIDCFWKTHTPFILVTGWRRPAKEAIKLMILLQMLVINAFVWGHIYIYSDKDFDMVTLLSLLFCSWERELSHHIRHIMSNDSSESLKFSI